MATLPWQAINLSRPKWLLFLCFFIANDHKSSFDYCSGNGLVSAKNFHRKKHIFVLCYAKVSQQSFRYILFTKLRRSEVRKTQRISRKCHLIILIICASERSRFIKYWLWGDLILFAFRVQEIRSFAINV